LARIFLRNLEVPRKPTPADHIERVTPRRGDGEGPFAGCDQAGNADHKLLELPRLRRSFVTQTLDERLTRIRSEVWRLMRVRSKEPPQRLLFADIEEDGSMATSPFP
jgi:hypothetical protein